MKLTKIMETRGNSIREGVCMKFLTNGKEPPPTGGGGCRKTSHYLWSPCPPPPGLSSWDVAMANHQIMTLWHRRGHPYGRPTASAKLKKERGKVHPSQRVNKRLWNRCLFFSFPQFAASRNSLSARKLVEIPISAVSSLPWQVLVLLR